MVLFLATFGFFYLLMQYAQLVLGYSPLQTALALAPLIVPVTRLPPRKPRTPGWYPYWYPNNYRHRYWDGQGWTNDYVSSWGRRPSGSPEASRRGAPSGWYPNPDGAGGQRWWNGETWSDPPTA